MTASTPVMALCTPPNNLIAHIEPGSVVMWKGHEAIVEAVKGEYMRIAVRIHQHVTIHVIKKIDAQRVEATA